MGVSIGGVVEMSVITEKIDFAGYVSVKACHCDRGHQSWS